MSDGAELSGKHALVIGVGARGQLAAAQLAAAGVGRIGLIDGASVVQSDLRSGPLTFTPDVGSGKADGMAIKLGLINDAVHAEPFPAYLDESNADLIIQGADVVIDCTDDNQAHLIASDACTRLGVSLVSGDLDDAGGWWAMPVAGHCLHSIVKSSAIEPAEATSETGESRSTTDRAIASAIASVQTAAAISLLEGDAPPSVSLLQRINARTLNWSTRELSCSSDCICRGDSAAGNV